MSNHAGDLCAALFASLSAAASSAAGGGRVGAVAIAGALIALSVLASPASGPGAGKRDWLAPGGGTVQISPPGESWLDSEALRPSTGEGLITGQDGVPRDIWVARLDAHSGLPVLAFRWRMGTEALPLSSPFNDPEFGADACGWSVYDSKGAIRTHRLLLMLRRLPSWNTPGWLDVASPDTMHDIGFLAACPDADVRWIGGTFGSVANCFSAETGRITNRYDWKDSDIRDGSLVNGVVGERELGARLGDGSTQRPSQRWRPPAGAPPFIGSPGLFVGDGRSYVNLPLDLSAAARPCITDQQIWGVAMAPGNLRAARSDDGRPVPVTPVDPEVFGGARQTFVYRDERGTAESVPYRGAHSSAGAGPTLRTILASDTDPAITDILGAHMVVVGPTARRNGRLLVFYPGTRATADRYSLFLTRAAELGYLAISLAYDNRQSINFEICPRKPESCYEEARLEILTGVESGYDPPNVDPANSAFNRLAKLLVYLDARHPQEGWGAYLSAGTPRWERIVVAGHSQGGGHAAMTARLSETAGALLFGATEPRAWTSAPFATPADRFVALAHAREPNFAGIVRSWANIGIPGVLTNMDETPPPFFGSNRLMTATEACAGDPTSWGYYHNCPVVDDFMAFGEDGRPVLQYVWDVMLGFRDQSDASPRLRRRLLSGRTTPRPCAISSVSVVEGYEPQGAAQGGLEWPAGNGRVLIARKASTTPFQMYTMNSDGSGLTQIDSSFPYPTKNRGNGSYSSDGKYIIFQAEMASHSCTVSNTEPGKGRCNNVWIMRADGSQFWQMTGYPDQKGVLYPRLNPSKSKAAWGYQDTTAIFKPLTGWYLAVADVTWDNGVPAFSNIQYLRPSGLAQFYEPSEWVSDTELLMAASVSGESQCALDIIKWNVSTGTVTNLTNSNTVWDEHAHVIPNSGGKIGFLSSQGIDLPPCTYAGLSDLKTEIWRIDADGSNRLQITSLNTPGQPGYESGYWQRPATSAWSSDGGYMLVQGARDSISTDQEPYIKRVRFWGVCR